MRRVIYMDHQATTPVDPRVLERMLPFFSDKFGNAASKSHPYGWEADEAVEAARAQLARLIGASPAELVFTSGATEANNLAILGVAEERPGCHVITQATEHKAVLDVVRVLEKRGHPVTVVPVDAQGRVRPADLEAALRPDTALVSLMAANNEIGTLQPLAELSTLCRRRGVLVHTDAAQAAGKVPLDVFALGLDLVSLSAHKMYGPKGVGALYVRRKSPRVTLAPILHGGGHERGRRSGTLNVPGIVGMGLAAELAATQRDEEGAHLRQLSARLYERLTQELEGVVLNGPPIAERLPGNLNLAFAGVEAEALILSLRDVAVSSGSACTSATLEPSHVLAAIGLPLELVRASLRFGLGRSTTAEEVDYVGTQVVEKVRKLRALNPRATTGISRGALRG